VTRTFGHDDEGPPAGRLSGLPQNPRKLPPGSRHFRVSEQ